MSCFSERLAGSLVLSLTRQFTSLMSVKSRPRWGFCGSESLDPRWLWLLPMAVVGGLLALSGVTSPSAPPLADVSVALLLALPLGVLGVGWQPALRLVGVKPCLPILGFWKATAIALGIILVRTT